MSLVLWLKDLVETWGSWTNMVSRSMVVMSSSEERVMLYCKSTCLSGNMCGMMVMAKPVVTSPGVISEVWLYSDVLMVMPAR